MRILLAGAAIFLMGLNAFAVGRRQRLGNDTWGGQHIRIAINEGTAQVDYDCASGEINGPLNVDPEGHFSWRGLFIHEHPGPVRIDENPSRQEAIYSGSIKGNVMSLTVKLARAGDLIGTFTLRRGSPGRVWKCK